MSTMSRSWPRLRVSRMRVAHLLRRHLVERQIQPPGDDPELVLGGRPLQVERNEQRVAALAAGPGGDLPARRRLAASLQPDEHEDRRRRPGEAEGLLGRAEDVGQLVADDLHDLLGGREAVEDGLVEGPDLDPRLEVLDHLVVDVGLEEGHPDHLQGFAHVFFGDLALALEELDRLLDPVGQLVEHGPKDSINQGTPSLVPDFARMSPAHIAGPIRGGFAPIAWKPASAHRPRSASERQLRN